MDTLKYGKKAVGVKQVIKAIETGNAKEVFIAKDADDRVVGKVKEQCQRESIQVSFADNMKLLGKACGIEVGAATACTLKR